tara:strand:- start:1318 stop:1533 length:216 start_codon:yes stop_codon:yes gene_type:complete
MKARKLLEQLQKMEGAKKIKEQLQKLDGNAEVRLRIDDNNNYYLSIRERFDYIIELDDASPMVRNKNPFTF